MEKRKREQILSFIDKQLNREEVGLHDYRLQDQQQLLKEMLKNTSFSQKFSLFHDDMQKQNISSFEKTVVLLNYAELVNRQQTQKTKEDPCFHYPEQRMSHRQWELLGRIFYGILERDYETHMYIFTHPLVLHYLDGLHENKTKVFSYYIGVEKEQSAYHFLEGLYQENDGEEFAIEELNSMTREVVHLLGLQKRIIDKMEKQANFQKVYKRI